MSAAEEATHRVDVFVTDEWGGQPVTVVLHEAQQGAPQRDEAVFVDTAATPGEPLAVHVVRGGREEPFSVNAALAAAGVLHQLGRSAAGTVRLAMPLGDVEVAPPAASDAPLWLRSPTITLGRAWSSPQVLALLGLAPTAGLPGLPVQLTSMGQPILLVPVADLAALSACRLDGAAFRGYAVRQVRHQALRMLVYVFCPQARHPEHQIAARLFLPAADPSADPIADAASGDAAACLGAYLKLHERLSDDGQIRIEQGHETGRPSLLRLRAAAGFGIEVGGRVRRA